MDTIIIDDEEKALDLLEFHLQNYFSDYSIIGRFTDVNVALEGVLKMKPDVIFLDINMPSGSGVEFLSKINHLACKVIFLTAHSEYAIEAIKHSAFDYLLKPINLIELNRVDAKIRKKQMNSESQTLKKITVQISNQVYLFESDEIIFAQSEGNYTTIYSTNQPPIIVTKNMKKVQEEYLSQLPFFRSHQSFVVNLNHILSYSSYEIILSNGKKVSLSNKNYQELAKLV